MTCRILSFLLLSLFCSYLPELQAAAPSCQSLLNEFISEKHLILYLQDGNKKFLAEDGSFVFEDSMIKQEGLSGIMNHGLYKAEYQERTYFIKKIRNHPLFLAGLHKEVRHAHEFHRLGIGPEVWLVKKGSSYYLVQEYIPGLNIKDIEGISSDGLPPKNPEAQLSFVSQALEHEFKSIEEARLHLARKVLESERIWKRLYEIRDILIANHLSYVGDFQFMIVLPFEASALSEPIYLIDAPTYSSNAKSGFKHIDQVLETLQKRLRKIVNDEELSSN